MSPETVRPLVTLDRGRHGTVVGLDGGATFQERIVSMGVDIGCEVEVLQRGGAGGPLLIATGETRLAIGRGMAAKVLVAVDPLPADTSHA